MSWHASGGACIAVHDNGRVCPCFGASKAVADELVSRNPKPEYWCVNCEKGWEEHDDDNCKWTVYLRPPVE